jgi:hypothetical protein
MGTCCRIHGCAKTLGSMKYRSPWPYLALLLVLVGVESHSAMDPSTCPILVQRFGEVCFYAAYESTKALKERGVDMSEVSVLYLGDVGWCTHAVVKYRNQIYDGRCNTKRDGTLAPVPAARFFEETTKGKNAEVRVIPSEFYLQKYLQLGNRYFEEGLEGFGVGPNHLECKKRFPTFPMAEFIDSLPK